MSDLSVQEQLLALKMMTAKTGVLHDAQVTQLKLWPWVVFGEKMTSYEIGVKPESDKKYLEYRITGADGVKALPSVGCTNLKAWVRQLLGQDWTVVIKLNGSEVRSKKTHGHDKPQRNRNKNRRRKAHRA